MAARPEVTGRKTGRRLLDYQAIRARGIPWSRVHLARLEAAGKFPLHIDVGENSIAWFEDEIDDFLEAKAAEREAKAAARAKPQAARDEVAAIAIGCEREGCRSSDIAGVPIRLSLGNLAPNLAARQPGPRCIAARCRARLRRGAAAVTPQPARGAAAAKRDRAIAMARTARRKRDIKTSR